MTRSYALAVQRVGWLLDSVEQWLSSRPNGVQIDRSELRGLVGGRRATDDELAAVLAALSRVGAIEKTGSTWRVSQSGIERSEGYRVGIREGLRLAEACRSGEHIALVATVPHSMDAITRGFLLREASDLRLAVVDLIASAQKRIVLASPFWDEETADDLQVLLARRITAGVRVDLLGRAIGGPTASGSALKALARRLDPTACRAVAWFRSSSENQFGTETFHFKLAIADDGARAYLGTANFTSSGFRSRMELGIVATGSIAQSLARILDRVLRQ
jgi:phosphatidylserine/phosphatidylglycerophosphate/cardiolipin synthase-like enzyme